MEQVNPCSSLRNPISLINIQPLIFLEMHMIENSWVKEFPGAITVCDKEGIILAMNDRSILAFAEDGGEKLIGTNLMDCHPQAARSILEGMISECRRNVYTIEKNGMKKLIYQTPWFKNGKYCGFVEMALEIPFELPHFIRE
jgi:transcriptional regulator with PAS, ATPase and Fis domain